MFILTQIKYQLFRSKGRSILAICAAAMLCGAMAFYMGNIQTTQRAIGSLADNIPVTVTVVNRNASKKTELYIEPKMLDSLKESGVKDLLATAEAAGAWSETAKKQDPFWGGDMTVSAINDIRAWEGVQEDKLEWMPDVGASVFQQDQAACVLSEQWAKSVSVELGGEVSVAVYAVRRNSSGVLYEFIENAAFRVAGIYHGEEASEDMHISTGWMRAAVERKGSFFSYASATCRLANPKELNNFKDELPRIGFMQPFDDANNLFRGDAIAVDDEMFIKTDSQLHANLSAFQRFLLPFFALVASLVTLITFLMLRGCRRDMAIASSLGQPKWQTFLSNFCSMLLTYLGGCMVIVPVVVVLAGITFIENLTVCVAFMVCAAIGVTLALIMLLRFDTLSLLIGAD